MTLDPIAAYRDELRRASARRACRYRRRRRLAVGLAIVFGAFLVASGAIAAQRTWFDDRGTSQIRIRYTEDDVVGLSEPLKACLAAHGAPPEIVSGAGAVFRNASAALSQCGAFATAIRLMCSPSPSAANMHHPDECVVKTEWMPGVADGKSP